MARSKKKQKHKHLKEKEKRLSRQEKIFNSLDEETKENLQTIEREIKSKKDMPEEEINKIKQRVFENMVIAVIIMLFLYLISLGSINIETDAFIIDLKVFSISLIVLTIILFEYSYKKENGNICIHGIECMILAILTLFSIYVYTFYIREFDIIVTVVSLTIASYYIIKAFIVSKKMKKQYFTKTSEINEIIKNK